MQQSQALYSFNFIVKKQKILKITSSFRISLDLFELATFGRNYGLQTANKATTGCTKVALRYFGQLPAKRHLKMIDTLVFFSENLILQNAPTRKYNGLRSGDFGGHCRSS